MSEYKYIAQVGIELEGGWDDLYGTGLNLVHDGSVNIKANYVGEIVSQPLAPLEVGPWMLKVYPDKVNETCGLHVHISVKKIGYYALLMDLEFQDFLIEALKDWGEKKKIRKDHPFWKRVNGENTYCSFNFWPERQWNRKEHHGERYTALNYTWARFKTVECRVLAGFKQKEIAVDAVYTIINAFEKYLELKKDYKEPKEIYTISDKEIEENIENIISNIEIELDKEDENFLERCESVDVNALAINLVTPIP